MNHLKRAADAERLLNDPAFIAATTAIETQTIKHLKETQLDGKPETERYVMELVRILQSGTRFQRLLWQHIDSGKLADDALERKRAFRKGGIG